MSLGKEKKKLSLIEVVVATSLMAVAMIPIMGVFTTTNQGTEKNFRLINAINIASERMNQALLVDWNAIIDNQYPNNFLTQTVFFPNNASQTVRLGKEPTLHQNTQFYTQLWVQNVPNITFDYQELDYFKNSAGVDYTDANPFKPNDTTQWRFSTKTHNVVNKLKKFTLTVFWDENNSGQQVRRSYSLTSFVSRLD